MMLLWQEHGAQHSGQAIHSYSQFCENYRRYAKSLKRSMRQIHRAGEKLFIDYAGPTVELTDGSRAHIFAAALGALSYTFACATVELLHRGQRVASYLRCAHKGGFTTVPEHLSAAHRAHTQWTPERLIHWGNSIGVATGALVTRLLESRKHPEHGYRPVWAYWH